MQVSEAEKEMYIETAKQLKGHARRLYMARVVKALGRGGQLFARQEFGWDRNTIRKGTRELDCVQFENVTSIEYDQMAA